MRPSKTSATPFRRSRRNTPSRSTSTRRGSTKRAVTAAGPLPVGVNRLDPALLHVFDYLKSKDIGVYLELYSSGIYTSQNGEVGNQPLVRERYGKQKIVKGIPLDLDCLEDVFEKYDIVKGVRFHELIGTHEIGLNGNPHGFTVDFDFLTEVAEACKKHDRRLVWGDHSWFLAYTEPGKYGMWLDHLRKACETLGDNITVNYSNNGWGGQQYSRNTPTTGRLLQQQPLGLQRAELVVAGKRRPGPSQMGERRHPLVRRRLLRHAGRVDGRLHASKRSAAAATWSNTNPRSTPLTSTIPDRKRKTVSANTNRRPTIRPA